MPKKRKKENKGLPARCRWKNGAIRYRVPPGLEYLWDGKKEATLGKTIPEAYRKLAEKELSRTQSKTIGDLLDRYALEVIPLKKPATRRDDLYKLPRVKEVFGLVPIEGIKPRHIYQYYDKREAKTAAKREIALLSHAYTKAVEWGYIDRHPFKKEVRLQGDKPRTRYVEDWEIEACLSVKPYQNAGGVKAVHAYIRLKLLTGLRRKDLLEIKMSDLKDDGLYINVSKTGKDIIFNWSEKLYKAVEDAKAVRPVDISPYLFCTNRGKGYISEITGRPEGWASNWRRFMDRALKETPLKERFTEHDLRAKVASDAENLERARELMTHSDTNITRRVYRRKADKIDPVK